MGDTSIRHAAQYLREKPAHSSMAVNLAGPLTGIISRGDISEEASTENKFPARMKVADIMTRELITAATEKTLEGCLRLVEQKSIFHLIVLDVRQRFHGMLSVTDLLQIVASDEKARANLLEAFIFPQT
jgi:predicted transcriptional regulator